MDRFDVVVFEDQTGTRFIYCDAAVAAISGPAASDKVIANFSHTLRICKGTNCNAIDGNGHSAECIAEHDAIVGTAALADHVAHGGWKCDFCGYDGQDNQRGNRFCSACHRHL